MQIPNVKLVKCRRSNFFKYKFRTLYCAATSEGKFFYALRTELLRHKKSPDTGQKGRGHKKSPAPPDPKVFVVAIRGKNMQSLRVQSLNTNWWLKEKLPSGKVCTFRLTNRSTRADSQWIVPTRGLCHVQNPVRN